MEKKMIKVFQTDSDIIKKAYQNDLNFKIEYNVSLPKEYCAIYFTSNFIYYPNTKEAFQKSVVFRNRYEWTNLKLDYVHKHIFIRDIKKQWYLDGINSKINSPDNLQKLLLNETRGYKIITVGSSAGGYASVLYGQKLKAQKIYTFNGQFEIASLLKRSSEKIDPLVFRHQNNTQLLPYYDLKNFIIDPESIFYFVSLKSAWDISQLKHIKELGLNIISFRTSHHGVPFPKILLNNIFRMTEQELLTLGKKSIFPLVLSIKKVGFFETTRFLVVQLYRKVFKK